MSDRSKPWRQADRKHFKKVAKRHKQHDKPRPLDYPPLPDENRPERPEAD